LARYLGGRKCSACGANLDVAPKKDNRRHHCLSVGLPDDGPLPESCWRRRAGQIGKTLLQALPAYRQHEAADSTRHRRRRGVASELLRLLVKPEITEDEVVAQLQDLDPKDVRLFFSRVPNASPLQRYNKPRPALKSLLGDVRKPRKQGEPPDPEAKIQGLPEPMRDAIRRWSEISQRIYQTRLQRGGRYSAYTVRRRVNEAIRFCWFLDAQEITAWPEVSQRHLDLYMSATTSARGDHAYTFLIFVRKHFRLTHRFVRPRIRKKAITEALLDEPTFKDVVNRAATHPNMEVALVLFLVALYGQTVIKSADLRMSQVKRGRNGLEALFADMWIPLDKITAELISKLAQSHKLTISRVGYPDGEEGPRLITASPRTISEAVRKLAQCSIKQLRLTAVANLIRSGFSDRASISRALGIPMLTVKYVESAFPWDLQETLSAETIRVRNKMFLGPHGK